jgi:hypothetical protein
MYNILPEETKEERWKRLNSRTATPAQQRARKAEQERRKKAEEILSDIQALGRASKGTSSTPSRTSEFNTPDAEVRKLKPGQKVDTLAVKAKKAMQSEALDPVGKEDSDIDNDGRKNTKSDKYLLNRRRVRSSYINKNRVAKEEYSDWRDDLCEILHLIEKEKNDEKIQEKKNINNKIKINPAISEAVENLGGTLLEMVELDEIDYIIESVYDELYNEGYYEGDIKDALEYALTEAKVTFGHDTPSGEKKKKRNLIGALGRLARQKLSSAVRGAQSKKRKVVSTVARKVADKATKIANRADSNVKHARRDTKAGHDEIMRNNREYQTAGKSSGGYRNVGVGRREKVSSGSYQTPASPRPSASSKKPETPKDPWEGSATTPRKTTQKPGPTGRTSTVSAKPLSKEQEQAIKRATRRNPNLSKSDADRIAASVPSKKSKAEELRKRMAAAAERRGYNESYGLLEKAESKQQQKIFGLALSVKRGETPRSKVSPQVLKMVDGMSEKDIRDFAKTKHKGLPKKKIDEAKLPKSMKKGKKTKESKTQVIHDVDDNLADQRHPDAAKIDVMRKTSGTWRRVKSLTPSQFAHYKLRKPGEPIKEEDDPGDKYGFNQFRSTKIFRKTTKPNKPVVRLGDSPRRPARKSVVTARGGSEFGSKKPSTPMDKPGEFAKDLKTRIGVRNLKRKNVHFTGGMRTGSGPEKKGEVVKKIVKPDAKKVITTDDHLQNVRHMAAAASEVAPKAKVRAYQSKPATKPKGKVKAGDIVPVRVGKERDLSDPKIGIRKNIDAPKTTQEKQRARKKARKGMKEAVDVNSSTSSSLENQTQTRKNKQQQDRMRQQEIQIMQRKLQALKSAPRGSDPSITT